MRSRCDRPAQVRLTYDTLRCRVFLDELPDVTGLYQEICEFHAVRLKLPMGWELTDRRGTTPTLFDLEALVRSAPRRPDPIVTRDEAVGTETIDLSEERSRSRPLAPQRPIVHAPQHPTGGLRSAGARSPRGRGPLPTPSELFGIDRLPRVDTTPDVDKGPRPGDGSITVVSVGDPSIETVIVLGPEPTVERSDSTGARDGRSL